MDHPKPVVSDNEVIIQVYATAVNREKKKWKNLMELGGGILYVTQKKPTTRGTVVTAIKILSCPNGTYLSSNRAHRDISPTNEKYGRVRIAERGCRYGHY